MMSLTSYRYPTMFMCPRMVPYASLEIVRSISKYNFPSSWLKMTLMIPLTSNEIVKSPWWCYNISRFTTEFIVPSSIRTRHYCVLIPCDGTCYNTIFTMVHVTNLTNMVKLCWWAQISSSGPVRLRFNYYMTLFMTYDLWIYQWTKFIT